MGSDRYLVLIGIYLTINDSVLFHKSVGLLNLNILFISSPYFWIELLVDVVSEFSMLFTFLVISLLSNI